MNTPCVFSIVVPVFHGGDLLRQSLKALSLLHSDPDRFEVLVAGPSGGPAQSIVRDFATGRFHPRYVGSAERTRAGWLNMAIALASGCYLAFIDDDVFVPDDWLTGLETAFSRHPDAGLIGGADAGVGVSPFDLAFDALMTSPLGSGRLRAGKGMAGSQYSPRLWNMAMPRRVALEVAARRGNGSGHVFNPRLSLHEDCELASRVRELGRAVVFVPGLVVRHRRDTNLPEVIRRDFAIARVCRAEGLHPGPHRLLAGVLAATLLLAATAIVEKRLLAPLLTGALAYVFLLAVLAVEAGLRKRSFRVFLMVPVLAAGLHTARAAGYLLPPSGLDRPPRQTT